jgi:hypothetical protein
MSENGMDNPLGGLGWCVILSIVIGFLVACGLLIIDDQSNGELLYRSDLDLQAKNQVEFQLVVFCTVTSCVVSVVLFGIWKAASYYNSPEQERMRILRRHPPLYGQSKSC